MPSWITRGELGYSLDANVLLHASNLRSPWHREATEFLKKCTEADEILWLAWPTVMAYLRISTHPSIFSTPLHPAEAEENIGTLLGLPQVRLLSEDHRFWWTYRSVTSESTARGNLVPDTHLAALLLCHGVKTLYTKDRDFQRFGFLEVREPF
jgi:uncharacterized protein